MTYPKQGDILLFHGTAFVDRLIQVGERIRDTKAASYWNHAAYCLDGEGTIIQATGKGVEIADVATTNFLDVAVIPNPLGPIDTAQAIAFALSCKNVEYGYLEIVSIGLDLLTPHFVHFKSGDTLICSELVARCLEHGGWISPKLDTSHVMPSDLATWFHVPTT